MTESRDPREEAERLIASVLGGASVAAENLDGFATGSAECCVCPVCKAIAAARDPNPKVAEKLATGAGDLASGVASFLRTMARAASDLGNQAGTGATGGGGPAAPKTATAPGGSATTEDPWATATRAAAEAEAAGTSAAGATAAGTTAAGTTAAGATAAGASAPGAEAAGAEAAGASAPGAAEPAATPNPPRPMAKKAVKPKAPADPPAEENQHP